MGQNIYFHNITKNQYNINDFGDVVEQADKNDTIKFSERGCAIIYDIRKKIANESDEFESIRNHFYQYFKEFHEKNFNT